MNRALTFLVTLLIASLGLSASAAILPPTNSALCATNLLIARLDSAAGGISQARAILAELNRRWGVQEDQDPNAGLSFQDLQIDSRELKDGDDRLAALGQQLTDLELSLKLMESDSDGNPFNFITGYTVTGSAALAVYTQKLHQTADYLSTAQMPASTLEGVRLSLYILMTALSPYATVFEFERVASELTKLTSGEIPNPITLVYAAIWGGLFAEGSARALLDRDWSISQRMKEYEKFGSEQSTTRRWLYRSYSHRLPRNLVSALNSRALTGHDILQMRIVDRETDLGRFLERKLFKSNEEYDWVYVDELLSRDPATQEPVLSVIVRASTDKDRPRPPKRKKPVTAPERKLVTDDGWKF